MPATRTVSTPLAAAAGSTTNSATIDNSSGYGGIAYGTMVNGATGPTQPCIAYLRETPDSGTTWVTIDSFPARLGNGVTTPFRFPFDLGDYKLRVQFTNNTGQSVTCTCYAVVVTGT